MARKLATPKDAANFPVAEPAKKDALPASKSLPETKRPHLVDLTATATGKAFQIFPARKS